MTTQSDRYVTTIRAHQLDLADMLEAVEWRIGALQHTLAQQKRTASQFITTNERKLDRYQRIAAEIRKELR